MAGAVVFVVIALLAGVAVGISKCANTIKKSKRVRSKPSEYPSCANSSQLRPYIVSCLALNTKETTANAACVCKAVQQHGASAICSSGSQSRDYLQYVQDVCIGPPGALPSDCLTMQSYGDCLARPVPDFIAAWPDAALYEQRAYATLFPWQWTVSPTNSTAALSACHGSEAKLGVFAVTNAVVLIALLVLGRRSVVQRLTCGFLGQPDSPWWVFSAAISLLLSITGNFINAAVVRSSPGYEAVPIGQLALLWFTRPRLAWMAAFLVAIRGSHGMEYDSVALSAITSEAVLQLLGSYYLGRTVQYGVKNRFYRTGYLDFLYDDKASIQRARLMYSGALLWVVSSVFLAVVYIALSKPFIEGLLKVIAIVEKQFNDRASFKAKLSNRFRSTREQPTSVEQVQVVVEQKTDQSDEPAPPYINVEDLRLWWLNWHKYNHAFLAVFATGLVLPFIGQWLFWVGFVELSEDRYCPPGLVRIAAVWIVTSLIGLIFGSSL